MEIVIKNVIFEFNTACAVLKLQNETPPFAELEEFWDKIKPITFKEIAELTNMEQRRIALGEFGIDRLVNEIKPKLLKKETINKKTIFIDTNGEEKEHHFEDTYKLFKVDKEILFGGLSNWDKRDTYYVECKDTSTDRKYLIWVDINSIYRTNSDNRWLSVEEIEKKVTAIQAIAWTIQTNVPIGSIKRIIRQGDCILIEPKKKKYEPLNTLRHLTEKEYRKLLVLES
jgi:uncharacterized DUF497 family protein